MNEKVHSISICHKPSSFATMIGKTCELRDKRAEEALFIIGMEIWKLNCLLNRANWVNEFLNLF